MLHFSYGEGQICSTIKKSQNIMNINVSKFFLLFMCLLTALIVKNSYFGCDSLYFSIKSLIPNLKGFQYQIRTSVKRLGKYLPSKTNLSTFLQISCCSFKLKLCQRP